MQLGMTRRYLGRSTAAAKEKEEEKMRLKQVNNACSLFLNRSFSSFPDGGSGHLLQAVSPLLGSSLFKCGLLPWLLVHRRV